MAGKGGKRLGSGRKKGTPNKATAAATEKPERSIQRAAARGGALGDDLGAVTGTSLDKGVELDAQPLCSLDVIPIAEAARSVA